MADKRAWQDFKDLTDQVMFEINFIRGLAGRIKRLEDLKAEILDDTTRRAELVKIFTVHPTYSLAWIQARLTKLSELKTWLEDNGYLD